jgi:hypothetical protein
MGPAYVTRPSDNGDHKTLNLSTFNKKYDETYFKKAIISPFKIIYEFVNIPLYPGLWFKH